MYPGCADAKRQEAATPLVPTPPRLGAGVALSTEMATAANGKVGGWTPAQGSHLSALAITCAAQGANATYLCPVAPRLPGNLCAERLNSLTAGTITGLPLAWQKC
jgi:hypothetical protein